MKSNRAKSTDIPMSVKQKVWERDGGRCIICGNTYNVMPNAHYIPRRKGGLGIEENIVTLCTNFTKNKCHYMYDHSTRQNREKYGIMISEYLKSKYPHWNEEMLYYKNRK